MHFFAAKTTVKIHLATLTVTQDGTAASLPLDNSLSATATAAPLCRCQCSLMHRLDLDATQSASSCSYVAGSGLASVAVDKRRRLSRRLVGHAQHLVLVQHAPTPRRPRCRRGLSIMVPSAQLRTDLATAAIAAGANQRLAITDPTPSPP